VSGVACRPHNLDAALSTFVGRADELAAIGALLARRRLVTLAGVGGCGKTRLAAESCRRIACAPEGPADGVWWVDLGTLTSSEDVAFACLKALGMRVEPEREALTTLAARLAGRETLICLDTCEHVLDGAAGLAGQLLRAAPGLTLIVTSREPLAQDGEVVFRVPPLSASDAAELFRERASLVAAGADPPDAAQVAVVCERVDRLPLAIELAAAWTRVLTPSQLLASLEDRFRLLAGGPRGGTARHRTLDASITWSYDLLADKEQGLFRRLSVFSGYFGLPAVTEVAAGDLLAAEDVLPVLARLVDTSLVLAEVPHAPDGQVRYRLLDTVRQYGAGKLAEAGETEPTRDRHLQWCTAAAERVAAGLESDHARWLARAEATAGNLNAALGWALDSDPPRAELARRLAAAIVMPWFLTGRAHAAVSLLPRAIGLAPQSADAVQERLRTGLRLAQMVSAPSRNRGEAAGETFGDPVAQSRDLVVQAFHAFLGDHAACERLGLEAAGMSRHGGDAFSRDFGRIVAAYSLVARNRHAEATECARSALHASRLRGDRFCAAFALGVEQYGAIVTGYLDRAVTLGRAMVDTIEPLGDYFGRGTLRSNLALAMALAGDPAGARAVMRPVVESIDTAPDVNVVGFQVALGHICLQEGAWQEALRWFDRGLRRLDHADADWTAARCLAGAIEALRRLGSPDDAAALLSQGREVAAHFDAPELDASLDCQHALLVRENDPVLAHELLHRALDTYRAAGLATFLPRTLEALVELETPDQVSARTVTILAAATAGRSAAGYPPSPAEAAEHESLLARLTEALGEEFDAAWTAGLTMTADQAIGLLRRGRGPRDRPRTGWPSLTPTETEVARLVSRGLSNAAIGQRLFMSRSTVKTHLAHIFGKLQISNRAELAAAVGRDDPGWQ
jgi:predicted ATPase/DNA-binding CsgD family transcriptional regulator